MNKIQNIKYLKIDKTTIETIYNTERNTKLFFIPHKIIGNNINSKHNINENKKQTHTKSINTKFHQNVNIFKHIRNRNNTTSNEIKISNNRNDISLFFNLNLKQYNKKRKKNSYERNKIV